LEHLAKYVAGAGSDSAKEDYAAFAKAWTVYEATFDKMIAFDRAGNKDAAAATIAEYRKEFLAVQTAIDELVDTKVGEASAAYAAGNAIYLDLRTVMALLAIGGVLGGVVLGVLLARSITRPLGRAAFVADAIASGDLSQNVGIRRQDEVG